MKELVNILENCGYEVYLAKDKCEALEISKKYILSGMSIGLGGSQSVNEIGLYDYLLSRDDIDLFNQYEDGISMEENIKRRRLGIVSDLYITSTNALSKDGKLINADGSGNRVAALIYGPKKVLLIVGKNKIVENVQDGFARLMNVCAVKNIKRVNDKSISMGKKPKANLDNIANKFSYIKADRENRIILILVDEDLGF